MDDKRSLYRNKFDFFVSGFISMFSLSLAVYAIYISGGDEAMNHPIPLLVWIGIIIAGIFGILAIYNWIRAITTPKDNRLDNLIQAVKDLKPSDNLSTKELTNIKNLTKDIDELKNLKTELDYFFKHLKDELKDNEGKK